MPSSILYKLCKHTLEFVKQLLKYNHAVCLQGCHGNIVNVDRLRYELGPQFEVHYIFHPNESAGGRLTMYDNKIWQSTTSFSIAAGRILISELDENFVIINVRNHDLSIAQIVALDALVSEYICRGMYILLSGDFNIAANCHLKVSEPFRKSPAPAPCNSLTHFARFRILLDKFIENYQPDCIHFLQGPTLFCV